MRIFKEKISALNRDLIRLHYLSLNSPEADALRATLVNSMQIASRTRPKAKSSILWKQKCIELAQGVLRDYDALPRLTLIKNESIWLSRKSQAQLTLVEVASGPNPQMCTGVTL